MLAPHHQEFCIQAYSVLANSDTPSCTAEPTELTLMEDWNMGLLLLSEFHSVQPPLDCLQLCVHLYPIPLIRPGFKSRTSLGDCSENYTTF